MRPKVGIFDFACCEGCQLTVVDSLQTHLELVEAVEIVQFREAMTEKGEDYQIAFVEDRERPGGADIPADVRTQPNLRRPDLLHGRAVRTGPAGGHESR